MHFTQRCLIFILCLIVSVGSGSCTKKDSDRQASSLGIGNSGTGVKTVNLAIWSNYVTPELLAVFENRTGIHVEVSHYSSNEELLAKLQAGASGYDVIVPSDYMVFAMVKLGLLREVDYSLLPNARNLDSKYLRKSYDPQNKHSVPFDWGTTGIAVHRKLFKGTVKGWKSLFENDALAGKFTLLDDVRETLGAALKAQGFSLNSTNPIELEKAKALLLRVRKRVKAFTSEPKVGLETAELVVSHVYGSDAFQARRSSGGKVDYIIPDEGGTLWIDNLVVPSTAPHPKEAHALMNFLLEPKSNAALVMNVLVSPVHRETFALLPQEVRANKMMFPSDSVLAKCEMIQDLGEALSLWDRIWTEVKARN